MHQRWPSILTAVSAVSALISLSGLTAHLLLGLDPDSVIRFGLTSLAILAGPWLWWWSSWKRFEWVELVAYTILIVYWDRNTPADLLGLFYVITCFGIVYRSEALSRFAMGLGVLAIWSQSPAWWTAGPDRTWASLTIHTLLLVAIGLGSGQIIRVMKRQEHELVRAQARLTEQMANQWALSVEAKSPYTGGHVQRVTTYTLLLAPHVAGLDMCPETLRMACILHDVGKISVPDSVLQKDGPLTPREWETMKRHPITGYDLVRRTGAPDAISAVVRHHHERWDGKGYPDQLAGEAIPIAARVVAVADAFDAMTSHRSYRATMTPEQAFREVIANSGTQFDPSVVKAFERVYPQWVAELVCFRAESA